MWKGEMYILCQTKTHGRYHMHWNRYRYWTMTYEQGSQYVMVLCSTLLRLQFLKAL